MRRRELDARIDTLYQLPLDEFTAARNALAREAGADAGEVRRLQKPPVAAWAVNQLYWKNRAVYDALVKSATGLRGVHESVLAGRRADLRGASKAHDEALDRALKGTLELLADAGHAATDTTRQAVLTTLRALPSVDPPGRLARTLQPGGFEMLSGLRVAPANSPPAGRAAVGPGVPKRRAAAVPGPGGVEARREDRSATAKRRAAAREALADATRTAREAETDLRRQEFAAARAAKEADRAAARVDQARAALDAAEREVSEAERAAAAAAKARERARRDAADARAALDTARARLEAAQQAALT